jgi:hypothetical protein
MPIGKERSPEGAIIFWSGIAISAGLVLIVLQLGFEAYYIHSKGLRQFGSFYIGLIVLLIGAGLMAVAFVASRIHREKMGGRPN